MSRLIDADKLFPDVMTKREALAISQGQLAYAPTVEAILKDQYETRLKADMVAMLTEIQAEIEELNTPPAYQDEDYFLIGTDRCSELIQQKIDALKMN